MSFSGGLCALALAFLAFNVGSIAFFRPSGDLPLRLKAFLGFVPVFQGAALAGLYLAPPEGWRQLLLVAGAGVSSAIFFFALVSARRQRFGPIFGGGDGPIANTGAFRLIRHPFYTAYISCYLSLAVGSGLWPVAAGALALIGLYVHAAVAEERALAAGPHGAAYRQYCRRTGRFFPVVVRPRRGRRVVTPVPMSLELSHSRTK